MSRVTDDRSQGGGSAAAPDATHWEDVQAALAGEGEAYARLVGRHQDAIAAYMWRFTRDRRECEELVQDVFVEAYLSLRTFRGEAPWLHWLRRIATRVGYRFWRDRAAQRAQQPSPLAAWDRAAARSEDCHAAEAASVVHAVLEQVSPRDRLVLTLMYLEDCSVAEVSRLTGWTRTMVKVQAHRARGRLKKLLEQDRS